MSATYSLLGLGMIFGGLLGGPLMFNTAESSVVVTVMVGGLILQAVSVAISRIDGGK